MNFHYSDVEKKVKTIMFFNFLKSLDMAWFRIQKSTYFHMYHITVRHEAEESLENCT